MQGKQKACGGSALIIILGFLSILVVLVFSFAVKMQTEYRTARTAESNVRAEFVMVMGIHLTALEIGHPTQLPVSYWYYPRREVINGSDNLLVGSRTYTLRAPIDDFLSAPADRFIPMAVYNIAMDQGMTNNFCILPSQFGMVVPDPLNDNGFGDLSRVVITDFEPSGLAYCILNGSGYLDINAPYNDPAAIYARRYGKNIQEIRLNNIIAPASLTGLQAGRAALGRVEDMMELYAYRSAPFGFVNNPQGDHDLSLFGTYSSAIVGQYWDTNNESLVNSFALTGDVAYVTTQGTEVENAFLRAGFDQPMTIGSLTIPAEVVQGWLFTNLLEYLDDDSAGIGPRGLSQPCQEALPGLNEIALNSTFRCTRTADGPPVVYQYELIVNMELELWRPHVTAATLSQNCFVPIGRGAARIAPISGPPFTNFNSAAYNASVVVNSRQPTRMGPAPLTLTPAAISTNVAPYPTEVVYRFQVASGLRVKIGGVTGTDIDTVDGPVYITVTNTLPSLPTTVGTSTENSAIDKLVCMEAVDPRFNWDFSNGVYWVRGTNTMAGTNTATTAYLTNPANNTDYMPGDDIEKATYAFSANRVPLDTVGELGYLVVAPWRTIRLCHGSNMNQRVERVLDTFTLDSPGTRKRGLVNPNTCFTGVLQAVFNEAYMDLYPGDPGYSNVSARQAAGIASNMLMYTYGTPWSEVAAVSSPTGLTNGLLNVSQVGDITNVFCNINLLNSIGADCKMRREAILRNSVGLLSTRNVNYTAVLCASDEMNGGGRNDFGIRSASRVGAEHKAIAMVSRDPLTKELFIRHFRYLQNDGVLSKY